MPPKINYESREQALRTLKANTTERYERLDLYERYCKGTQYEGMPDFFDATEDVPLIERAPKIVYPIVSTAIRSNVDLCLGEGRFPKITAFTGDDKTLDDAVSVKKDSGDKLDAFIKLMCEHTGVKHVSWDALYNAQQHGTVVSIVSVRYGKVRVDNVNAKWCEAEFTSNDMEVVEELTIEYPYLVEEWDDDSRQYMVKCLMYRRIVDATHDTTFKPIECDEDGEPIKEDLWIPDPKLTIEHGLGFCPVIWHRHMAEHSVVFDMDGNAIHRHVLDEIDCINYGLSQRHRAALYSGEPQMWEAGVDEDENPSATGRLPKPVIHDEVTGQAFYAPNLNGGGHGGTARKKGPGVVWRYRNPEAQAKMLTLPGDALRPATDNIQDLRTKIAESMGVVFFDPDMLHANTEVSGRTLEWIHHRQTSRCDQIRSDFGNGWLLPVISMMLRVCLSVSKRGSLNMPGLDSVLPILKTFVKDVEVVDGLEGRVGWEHPRLELNWGPYFKPTELDQKQVVQATLALQRGGVITRRTSVERIAEFYGIGNIDEYVDELEKDAGQSQAIMQAAPSTRSDGSPGGFKQNTVPKKGGTTSGIIEPTARETTEL